MPIVYLIRVFVLFFELNLFSIGGTNDPKYLRKEPWKFRVIRDEKPRRKIENTWVRVLGRRASHSPSGQYALGNSTNQSAPTWPLKFYLTPSFKTNF